MSVPVPISIPVPIDFFDFQFQFFFILSPSRLSTYILHPLIIISGVWYIAFRISNKRDVILDLGARRLEGHSHGLEAPQVRRHLPALSDHQ